MSEKKPEKPATVAEAVPTADLPVEAAADLKGLVEFTYDDHTYRVPSDITGLDSSYADGILGLDGPPNHGLACKALLGEVQWAQFKGRRPTVGDYTGMIVAFTAALELQQGE